jgi:hypothetical protein
MTALLTSKFLEILNMGVASGASHEHEDHAPEGLNHEGQEKGQGRQVLNPEAAVRLGGDSRRLPRDYDGEFWA